MPKSPHFTWKTDANGKPIEYSEEEKNLHRAERQSKKDRKRELQQKVLQLRREGLVWTEIAASVGYSLPYVAKCYQAAMNDIVIEDVELERKKQVDLYEHAENILLAILKKDHVAVSGGQVVRDVVDDETGQPILDQNGKPVTVRLSDYGPHFAAVDRLTKIGEQRARLLGLYAPTKTALTDIAGKSEVSISPVTLHVYFDDKPATPD
jgi:hypothetical protein